MASQSQVKHVLGLKDGELSDIMSSLGVGPGDRDIVGLVMTAEEWTINTKIRAAIQYLGFDARVIVAQFLKKAKEDPADTTVPPTVTCGEARLYEKNDAKTDLLFFINTFLERGNNIGKAALRCDKVAGEILRRKASAYGIVIDPIQNRNILGTKEHTYLLI